MIGATLGHYRILSRIGRGGMGEVFQAEDTLLRRRVAIKRLAGALPDPERQVARLRTEAVALAAVNHPNVVTVHAVEQVDGVPFIVMELVEGRTVAEILPEAGFPVSRFLELAIAVAAGLEAAHASGVLHRDLKAGNVMVTEDGRVKVVDFGIAKVLEEERAEVSIADTLRTTGRVVGTVPYMAPEQLAGEGADRKSDLYSLGVLLFEMATGHVPFSGGPPVALMRRVFLDPPPSLRDERADLPERAARLVAALLAKDPGGRPASATIVVEELRRCTQPEHAPPAAARVAVSRAASRPVDLDVVQLEVRGRHLWNKRSERALRAALTCFNEAIDRDPMHAPAWVGIADVLNMLSNYGFAPPGDSHGRVNAAVERAIALEGESGDAFRARALAAWQFDFDWAGAEALYRRALALEPESAVTHHWYGVLLAVTGRFDECFGHLERAEALDPLSLISLAARGWFTLFAGRAADGQAMLQRVLALDASLHPALWFQGQALSALGRHDEAIDSIARAIDIGGRTSRMIGYLGYVTGHAGRHDAAAALLAELEQRRVEQYVPPYFDALVLSGMGERDRALSRLEDAHRASDTMVRDLGVDPPWWALRGQPRYEALLGKMGLGPSKATLKG